MKPITPFHAVAAAVLCTVTLSIQAAEPSVPTRTVSTVVVADETPVLLATSAGRPVRTAVHAGASSSSPGERGARAAAANGPDALRRYIDRTRMIYALRFEDFADR